MDIKKLKTQLTQSSFLGIKILFGGLVGGILLGYLFFVQNKNHESDCLTDLHFIKPTLDCRLSDEKTERLSTLEEKLNLLIDVYKKTGKANRVSVFVRDLKTTRFASVNEGKIFVMASLLKVPLVVAAYKLAEVEPKILEQDIVYRGVPNLYKEQNFKVSKELEVNKSYKFKEIMERSLVYSDNTAAQIIFDYYATGFFDRVLRALGFSYIANDGSGEDVITARSFSNIFRFLYNATYLTREYSNEVLEMLTRTEYKGGSIARLPKDVLVAHKFAERSFNIGDTGGLNIFQLHECGLVYAKNKEEPYIFCFMTEGRNFSELEQVQAEISLTVYETMVAE